MDDVKVSISLGTGALPEVREALAHSAAEPTHDPIVFLRVDDNRQHVHWLCWQCHPLEAPDA